MIKTEFGVVFNGFQHAELIATAFIVIRNDKAAVNEVERLIRLNTDEKLRFGVFLVVFGDGKSSKSTFRAQFLNLTE